MSYYWMHTKCGGRVEKRTCTKCKKRWSFFGALLDPSGLRQAYIPDEKPKTRKTANISGWAKNYPTISTMAERLPAWPRWLRLLVTILILALCITFWRLWCG